jgi:hypothetical protein
MPGHDPMAYKEVTAIRWHVVTELAPPGAGHAMLLQHLMAEAKQGRSDGVRASDKTGMARAARRPCS